jgi:hypothetical protein
MRSKLLWTIFALTQMIGALGAFYYGPHGSHAIYLYFAAALLLPGIIVVLLLPSLLGVGFDLGYILAIIIPVNFAVWFSCALLIGRIRARGPDDKS